MNPNDDGHVELFLPVINDWETMQILRGRKLVDPEDLRKIVSGVFRDIVTKRAVDYLSTATPSIELLYIDAGST